MAKKKDTKLSKAAYIKRHTEGTSNELSFSVLDAAKNRADVEEGKDNKLQTPAFGSIQILSWRPGRKKIAPTPTKENTLPLSTGESVGGTPVEGGQSSQTFMPPIGTGVQEAPSVLPIASTVSSAYLSPEDEIERRKKRRRTHRIIMVALVSAVSIALLGGGGYYAYNEIKNHQEQVSLLDRSLELIEEADAVLVPADKLINDSVDKTTSEDINALLEKLPAATEALEEARDLVTTSAENLRDSSEKEAAEQAIVAIEARLDMMAPIEFLLRADLQVEADKATILNVWDVVLEADEMVREAAALVVDTTDENVTASKEKSAEAITRFGDAAYLLREMESSSLSLNIQPFQDYIAKRQEALGYAIASDDAIIAREREIAQQQNDAYNAAESEASLMAKELPGDITQIVTEAFKAVIEDSLDQYNQARSKATTADAFLRDYLGT